MRDCNDFDIYHHLFYTVLPCKNQQSTRKKLNYNYNDEWRKGVTKRWWCGMFLDRRCCWGGGETDEEGV